MRITIIEDEQLTAQDLIDILQKIDPKIEIVAHLSSVQEALSFFSTKHTIDLILSDIQLGDGLSFEIFKQRQINTPVVFCTAYDEYALDAFKANGIDYILKPYSEKNIVESLQRYRNLQAGFVSKMHDFTQALESIYPPANSAILVHHKDKIIPLKIVDLAIAYIRNETVYLHTFDGKTYIINKSLDELMSLLGSFFFRANRQFIVNREAVQDISLFLTRKYMINLRIPFSEQITVSKEKMTTFLNWLKAHDSLQHDQLQTAFSVKEDHGTQHYRFANGEWIQKD